MAKVLLKKSSVPSNVPTTGNLDYGELAINYADGRLYYKNSSNVIKKFVDSAKPFILGSSDDSKSSKESKQSNSSSGSSSSSGNNGASNNSKSISNNASSNGTGPTGTDSNVGNRSANIKGTTGSTGTISSNTGPTGIGKTDISGPKGAILSATSSPKAGPTGI